MFSRSPGQSTLSLRSRAALPTTEANEIQNESRLSPQYCYVINYAPETGQPCYRLLHSKVNFGNVTYPVCKKRSLMK
jgi:hypothetical protein